MKREGIELRSDVTVPINVEMRVGALEETVTVTGETPVVDVQSLQRTQVLSRDVLEALPTSRAVSSLGQILPGVRMSRPDLGGTNSKVRLHQRISWIVDEQQHHA